MRLLNAELFLHGDGPASDALEDVNNSKEIPPYAIISHTWTHIEVTYRDLLALSRDDLAEDAVCEKIKQCCVMALKWRLTWVWMDTCCIDQSSSAELSEAINSMFQWYQQSSVCLAYLSDVDATEDDFARVDASRSDHESLGRTSSFRKARWFQRGWCLQELLAPRNMHFYNRNWVYIGSKDGLKGSISRITGIAEYGMLIPDLSVLSVAQRMSWAAKRETSRPEDIAYCLLGIFNINMPLLYGEGQVKAFYRLQEEIMRRVEDHSIFAWSGDAAVGVDFGNDMVGFLAPHPALFGKRSVSLRKLPQHIEPLSITGRGIRAQLPLVSTSSGEGTYAAVIGCSEDERSSTYYAIPVSQIKRESDVYRRRSPELLSISRVELRRATLETIFLLRQSNPTYLEDKDTMQVWFSLIEMRDCIYKIAGAYPLTHWNLKRQVFAFSPSDFGGTPEMAVIFEASHGQGFLLRMKVDLLLTTRSFCNLVELNEHQLWQLRTIKPKAMLPFCLSYGDTPAYETSYLNLEGRRISASVKWNRVFGQALYEAKVQIRQVNMQSEVGPTSGGSS